MMQYTIFTINPYTSTLITLDETEFDIYPEDYFKTDEWNYGDTVTWLMEDGQQYLKYKDQNLFVKVK